MLRRPAIPRLVAPQMASLAVALTGVVACGGSDYPAQSPPASSQRMAYAEERPGPWPSGGGEPMPDGSGHALATFRGQASYYGDSLAGHRTANGERYDPRAYTAAHRTLAFGTVVRVVRPDTGEWVTVRITDRGPFVRHRVLDLSRAAAERLHMIRSGVVDVRAEVIRYGVSRKRRK